MSSIIYSQQIQPAVPIESVKTIDLRDMDNLQAYDKYLRDESRLSPGGCINSIYFPADTGQLASVLINSRLHNIPVTVSGARTGISGGSVPMSGSLVSLEKMDGISGIGYDRAVSKWYLELAPCTALSSINELIIKKNIPGVRDLTPGALSDFLKSGKSYHYPVDPTELNASIGGTIASNASGALSYSCGPSRNWIRKLDILLYNGQLLQIPRGRYFAGKDNTFTIRTAQESIQFKIPDYQMPAVKNAAGIYSKTGMDLIDLFIGSEGIFGIISGAEIYLEEISPGISNLLFFPGEENAVDFVEKISCSQNLTPLFLEYIGPGGLELLRKVKKSGQGLNELPEIDTDFRAGVFFDLSCTGDQIKNTFNQIQKICTECGTSLEASWSAAVPGDRERLRKLRHALPESVNNIIAGRKQQYPGLHKLGTDISVPAGHFREMLHYYRQLLDEAGLEYVIFGHIGDQHVHVNILPADEAELESGKELYLLFAGKAVELKGSVSAEHGTGKMKKKYLELMFGPDGIEKMRRIKRALDPCGLINPGNMFDL